MSEVVLAYDEGPAAGLGHRRRMEALAAALHREGVTSRLVPASKCPPSPIVVLDSYDLRADRDVEASVVCAVDDLQRDLAVDLVIDPNPGATAGEHPAAKRVLAGAEFALVHPELRVGAAKPRAVGNHIVVTLGGSTRAENVDHLATCIAKAVPEASVVTTGLGNELVHGVGVVTDLPSLLSSAALVVCGGGVTMLESLVLERPTIALVVAENQRRAVSAAAVHGAVLAPPQDRVVETVAALYRDEPRRDALASAGSHLVDGLGAQRVAAAVADLIP